MRVTPISRPLPGEHIVAVFPTMAPHVEDHWPRRLNLYTGRALSDAALETEQTERAGRIAALAQMVSPGVVHGLEVALERDDANTTDYLHVGAGVGLSIHGEDARILKALRVEVGKLPVYGPSDLGESGDDTPEDVGSTGALRPRFLHGPLEEIVAGEGAASVPRASILVLQPIVAELLGDDDPRDPCERDPQNDAFADWQLADGVRLVLYSWPVEWMLLPTPGDQWRNRLAYAVFDREAALIPPDVLPWRHIGVPIALIGFESDWRVAFADRASVVRAGGRAKRGGVADMNGAGIGMVAPNAANPFLWQARIEQLAEEVAAAGEDTPMLELAARFRHLPPVGILPTNAVNARVGRTSFFPSSYQVDVAPIPLEQLDAVVDRSGALEPFDLAIPDRVRMFVPVPQVWYEPRLLEIEEENPEFDAALNSPGGFVERRNEWLSRRVDVRGKASALAAAITGEPVAYPDPDPDALEDEDTAAASVTLDPAEEGFGTELDGDSLVVNAILGLTSALQNTVAADELTEEVEGEAVDRVQELGLQEFIVQLTAKVDRADDFVDMSFIRVQADIYRVRQIMLGAANASRLATSPALASIAKGESAAATIARVTEFFNVLKSRG